MVHSKRSPMMIVMAVTSLLAAVGGQVQASTSASPEPLVIHPSSPQGSVTPPIRLYGDRVSPSSKAGSGGFGAGFDPSRRENFQGPLAKSIQQSSLQSSLANHPLLKSSTSAALLKSSSVERGTPTLRQALRSSGLLMNQPLDNSPAAAEVISRPGAADFFADPFNMQSFAAAVTVRPALQLPTEPYEFAIALPRGSLNPAARRLALPGGRGASFLEDSDLGFADPTVAAQRGLSASGQIQVIGPSQTMLLRSDPRRVWR